MEGRTRSGDIVLHFVSNLGAKILGKQAGELCKDLLIRALRRAVDSMNDRSSLVGSRKNFIRTHKAAARNIDDQVIG